MALVLAGDVLARCSQQFEAAAFNNALLCFELTVFDAVMLIENYEYGAITVSGQFQLFLNEALIKLQMPFKVTTTMGTLGSRRFYCHVERVTKRLGTL